MIGPDFFADFGAGGFKSTSGAQTGAQTNIQVSPWYQGDVVLATGGSTATGGDRTRPPDPTTLLSGLGGLFGGGNDRPIYVGGGNDDSGMGYRGTGGGTGGLSLGINQNVLVIAGLAVGAAVLWRFLK